MNNQGDNAKMASWFKFIVLGIGAAGALFGAAKLLLSQRERPHENGHGPRSHSSREERPQRECDICSNSSDEFVTFLPCMHTGVCSDCGARMRKCFTCKRPISERVTDEGKSIPFKSPSEDLMCSICYENKKRIIFNCGHTVCRNCSDKLRDCPMCRERIATRNDFF